MLRQLQLKKHALTAISYMLPVVVTAGLLIAIGNLTGGQVINDYQASYSVPDALVSLGVLGMGLLAPVISAAIAYSIADRPGIGPGLFMGLIANAIGAGFLGGMLGGYLVGFFVLLLVKYLKVPKWTQGLMPMMIIPLLATLSIGLLMFFVVGVPIFWATEAMTDFLQGLQGSGKFLFGSIVGGMAAFDFGGPVNKVASLFADGMLLEGVQEPEAVKVLASMVPPFGVTISWVLSKLFRQTKYSKEEENNIKIAFPMGLCMITEGVIPLAAVDPLRVIISCTAGAAIGGGLSMSWGIGSPVPSGGVFIIPAMTDPLKFTFALLIGSAVTGILLFILKKAPAEHPVVEEEEEEVDFSSIKLS
ncbi:PTS fructose transporter subunit IIC [Enterococcus hirae]|uniref:PTS fructose transporter subunit IIC n=1 Tax=Enterococcus hirae TaxID=1354 RepID=UPI000B546ACC|nr:PTS fructose transporter subunit IIC [Enterococcus hirae]OWW63255.1 PTS fructose transporter subunit IIC [Enterococcus hirae 67-03-C5]EMF0048322.1 PTS fructose transporter subunit IIC [Enterococcus hirae]EMF0067040.1 PTS fructose transporter subunit IIC [Enterococcus hirae]EMF0117080.1 PTS fructose transporter subunit IIC [Enterococcus hirae]EMF0153731.1 PTS fructose transporter subunit IIC [Enterococcus hirae]